MVEVAAQARIDGNIAGLERLNVGIGGETETLEEHFIEKCGVHFDVLVCVVLYYYFLLYLFVSQIKINQFFQVFIINKIEMTFFNFFVQHK